VATLADQFVAGTGGADILVTSRAFALGMKHVVELASWMLLLGVSGLAVLTAREGIVPRRLIGFPVAGGVLLVAGVVAQVIGPSSVDWVVFMAGFAMMLLWLIVAGLWLVLGNANRTGDHGGAHAAGMA
jgi:uncharacterized membrane protein YhaH (DUF805 family)